MNFFGEKKPERAAAGFRIRHRIPIKGLRDFRVFISRRRITGVVIVSNFSVSSASFLKLGLTLKLKLIFEVELNFVIGLIF